MRPTSSNRQRHYQRQGHSCQSHWLLLTARVSSDLVEHWGPQWMMPAPEYLLKDSVRYGQLSASLQYGDRNTGLPTNGQLFEITRELSCCSWDPRGIEHDVLVSVVIGSSRTSGRSTDFRKSFAFE
eukprot:scaffold2752_cov393-Prasinococcus_capsulatus_cf.AAC.8